MADTCATCGAKLGFMRRMRGAVQCEDCETREAKEKAGRIAAYRALLSSVSDPNADLSALTDQIRQAGTESGLAPVDTTPMRWQALLDAFGSAMADEVLTPAEEERLLLSARALDTSEADLDRAFGQLNDQVVLARVNDGRLPNATDTPIILRGGEIAHLVVDADLLKEVVHHEFVGGSRGVSVRLVRGVSYRAGAFRGHSVITGTSIEAADNGALTITSKRAVYTGARKTLDLPYTKLESLKVFSDGVQFHMINRQNPPLFRVANGPLVAAVVNGAAQSGDGPSA